MSKEVSVNSILAAIKEAGFTKIGYLGAALIFFILGWNTLFIAALSIAIYINANTIWKYVIKLANKKFDWNLPIKF